MSLKQRSAYEEGMPVKHRYYFGKIQVMKNVFKYQKDRAICTLYLFGMPVWRSLAKPEDIDKVFRAGGGLIIISRNVFRLRSFYTA